MLTHLKSGVKDLASLREGVEAWFNETMERLSGWFTRTARWVSFIIGLIVVVSLNVDTLVVANALWREPALRTAVADYAAENYKNYPPDSELDRSDIDSLRAELTSLELPIGWNTYGPDESVVQPGANWFQATCSVVWNWAPQHFIGWLFTALAVSLGAHFWFDLLSRFVRLRASGRSPVEDGKKAPEKT